MTCANCSEPAEYCDDQGVANAVGYCLACLPHHLRDRAAADLMPLPENKKK